MIDYLGLGGKRYIGNPKQPTLSIYQLIDGEYQVQQFRRDEEIISATFPDFKLTPKMIFAVGD
ncbi:MAG: Uma2 family endonuclease [Microcoleaceae cyanobacterium MO_207.B10]|nr:Uma2 family endonuclease [Microcoleaceae cyanobacterium MO_207.B10]